MVCGPSELTVDIRCKDYALYFVISLNSMQYHSMKKNVLIDILLPKNPGNFDYFPQISQETPNMLSIYSSSLSLSHVSNPLFSKEILLYL